MIYPDEAMLYAPVEWYNCSEGFEDIRYEKSTDGIAKITINRPQVRNAFRPLTVKEMIQALADARYDDNIGVIILTGAVFIASDGIDVLDQLATYPFTAPLGSDRNKRHRVFRTFAEQKCTPPAIAQLGPFKDMIDGLDHGVAGAEVGVQRVQATRSGLTRPRNCSACAQNHL